MNTIPLIFNEKQINRTILGGHEKLPQKLPFSVILLNKSGRTFREKNINMLLGLGFTDIISIEGPGVSYSIKDLSEKFPMVRFLIPGEQITSGEMINYGMEIAKNQKVLVIWDTMIMSYNLFSERTIDILKNTESICIVPFLFNNKMQNIPSKTVPTMENKTLLVQSYVVTKSSVKTLYPFDFVGLYDKEKLMNIGGFDYTITSDYWQLLDFALRANLWGEKFIVCNFLKISYECEVSPEDTTLDSSYLRFFLKNLAPRFENDRAYIHKREFLPYLNRSSLSFFEAYKTFKMARNWVDKNKYRFKTDAENLIAFWDDENE